MSSEEKKRQAQSTEEIATARANHSLLTACNNEGGSADAPSTTSMASYHQTARDSTGWLHLPLTRVTHEGSRQPFKFSTIVLCIVDFFLSGCSLAILGEKLARFLN